MHHARTFCSIHKKKRCVGSVGTIAKITRRINYNIVTYLTRYYRIKMYYKSGPCTTIKTKEKNNCDIQCPPVSST